MTDAVGAGAVRDGEASAPRQAGWAMLLIALLAFLALRGLPVTEVVAPVSEPLLLLFPALAACAIVGWGAGGSFWFAVVWVAFAWAAFDLLPVSDGVYGVAERGWSLLLAGIFGLVCVSSGRQTRFFARALATLALALGAACVAALAAGISAHDVSRLVASHMAHMPDGLLSEWKDETKAPWYLWAMHTSLSALATDFYNAVKYVLESLPAFGVRYFAALLALQSMFALMLGWWLYHRINRTRIGIPLGRLQDFRFNDQLVWGVIVGVVWILIPTLADVRGVGLNLTLFFGTLYALRGIGVFAWFLGAARFGWATLSAILALFIVVTLLGGASTPIAPAILGLIGLGDTFVDWRARARAAV
jgi:hypothetical protein